MTILQFPRLVETALQQVPDDNVAKASLITAFLTYSLQDLEDIIGLILSKLEKMDDQAVMAIYEMVEGDIPQGTTTTEMVLLGEIVSEEVARRCALNGWPLPWAEPDIAADNDQPEPDGAA